LLALAVGVPLGGCASVRNRLAHRSEECTQLCDQARQAREEGREGQADELLQAALKRRPTDSQTQLELAEELWSSGRQLAAADVVAKIVAERPDDAGAALRLAKMEYEIGRTAAAESALRLAMLNDPENPDALRLKAEMAQKRGDADTALATYLQLAQIVPDDLDAQLAMATIYIRRGHADRAAPVLRTVLQHPQATRPQRHDAEWQLGICYAQAERWHDAADALQNAIAHGQPTADDWYRVAYAQSRSGDRSGAQGSLGQALALSPNHLGALDLARTIEAGPSAAAEAVVPVGFAPGLPTATGPTRTRL
jgi:tetratricopeptide (TPR) repeat protein